MASDEQTVPDAPDTEHVVEEADLTDGEKIEADGLREGNPEAAGAGLTEAQRIEADGLRGEDPHGQRGAELTDGEKIEAAGLREQGPDATEH